MDVGYDGFHTLVATLIFIVIDRVESTNASKVFSLL